jgi:hypothetical protein
MMRSYKTHEKEEEKPDFIEYLLDKSLPFSERVEMARRASTDTNWRTMNRISSRMTKVEIEIDSISNEIEKYLKSSIRETRVVVGEGEDKEEHYSPKRRVVRNTVVVLPLMNITALLPEMAYITIALGAVWTMDMVSDIWNYTSTLLKMRSLEDEKEELKEEFRERSMAFGRELKLIKTFEELGYIDHRRLESIDEFF